MIVATWFRNSIWFVGHIAYDLLKSQNTDKKEKDKNKNEEEDSAQKK